jgi:hypothetical protein
MSKRHKMYVLYGTASRDRNEQVIMFFDSKKDLRDFVSILPGRYRALTIRNHPVAADDFDLDLRDSDSLQEDLR